MPVAISDHGFPDCREFMNKAAAAKKGWTVTFAERGSATAFRLRCYTARMRELKRNIKLYPEGEHMHGRTVWDQLIFLIKEDKGGWQVIAVQDGEAALEAQVVRQGPIE